MIQMDDYIFVIIYLTSKILKVHVLGLGYVTAIITINHQPPH